MKGGNWRFCTHTGRPTRSADAGRQSAGAAEQRYQQCVGPIAVTLVQPGCLRLVAGADRGQDLPVLGIRLDGKRAQFLDRLACPVLHVPELAEHSRQARISAERDQFGVEQVVQFRPLGDVDALRRPFHLGQDRVEPLMILVGDAPARGELGGLDLKGRENLIDLLDLFQRQCLDGDAVARPDLDQPLLLETDQRLAHRRPAERQQAGDLGLEKRGAGRQPALENAEAELVIGAFARRHLRDSLQRRTGTHAAGEIERAHEVPARSPPARGG